MVQKQGNLLGYARRAQRASVLRKFMWSLVLFLPISAVAAASIVINSGSTVEFGQGSAQVAPCDDSLNIEPTTELVDSDFKLDFVTVSEIDATACASRVFEISIYENGNQTPIAQLARVVSASSLIFDFSNLSPRLSTAHIGSITLEQAGIEGLTPTFSSVNAEIEGFNFTITNFDSDYSWSVSASEGTAALDSNTGVVSVTGLTSGQSSTVTVNTSRSGYSNQSAQITGTARTVLTFATSSESIVTTADYRNAIRGWGVVIAEDGASAVMGGTLHADTNSGVFVLEKSGSSWAAAERLSPSDQVPVAIDSYSRTSNVVTVNTASAHGFSVATSIELSDVGGAFDFPYSSLQTVTSVPSANSFTFTHSGADVATTPWGGTVMRRSFFATRHSLGMSNNANRIVVGDYLAPVSGKGAGKVYVYDKDGLDWNESAIDNPTAQNGFGESVAISGDGRTLLITHTQSTKLGAWVYYYDDDGNWVKQSNSSASGATDSTLLPATVTTSTANFGTNSAQLSSDGNTALVAAHGEQFNSASFYGAAYVFTRSGGVWTQEARLVGSDFSAYRSLSVAQNFGEWGSSLSPDGSVVAIGAGGDNDRRGSVYIFQKDGGSWLEVQKISNPEAVNVQNYGAGVALSESGNDVIVGAHRYDFGATDTVGIVYHYVRDGSSWSLQNTIEPETKVRSTEIAARTGQISITADGRWLMIGNGGTASTYRPYIMVLEGTP